MSCVSISFPGSLGMNWVNTDLGWGSGLWRFVQVLRIWNWCGDKPTFGIMDFHLRPVGIPGRIWLLGCFCWGLALDENFRDMQQNPARGQSCFSSFFHSLEAEPGSWGSHIPCEHRTTWMQRSLPWAGAWAAAETQSLELIWSVPASVTMPGFLWPKLPNSAGISFLIFLPLHLCTHLLYLTGCTGGVGWGNRALTLSPPLPFSPPGSETHCVNGIFNIKSFNYSRKCQAHRVPLFQVSHKEYSHPYYLPIWKKQPPMVFF